MWTVQNAKSKLSEVLRRAKAGEPQIIGSSNPCVVVSAEEYRRLTGGDEPHLGRWLLANMPRGDGLEPPSRKGGREIPFADSPARR
jgi:prevent-host-death family protein